MSLNIPDYMPVLSRGPHESPAEGACVMEYVSFLAGGRWSDTPACTNHTLALAAQRINDNYKDEERHLLLPLIPRLMGTNEGDEYELAVVLTDAAFGYMGDLDSHMADRARYYYASEDWAFAIMYATWAVQHAPHMDTIGYLSTLIDAYDKAVGRTTPAVVTADDLRRCAELTGATR